MLGIALFFLLGLIFGSFLNVLVIRRGALTLSGRSMCLSCGRGIRWYDNIPVVSWLLLHGRCRDCGSRISLQYPLVETLSGVLLALLASAFFPDAPELLTIPLVLSLVPEAALIALVLAIAVYDLRHTIIPDAWVYLFACLALVLSVLAHPDVWYLFVLAGPAVALPLFVLWLVSGGKWMGLGDAKFALGIGFFLGPVFGLFALVFAFIIGALVSIFVLLPLPYARAVFRGRGIAGLSRERQTFTMKSEVPFGPFLAASFILTWFAILYHIPLPIPL